MFRAALAALVTVVLTGQSLAVDIFVSPTGNGEKTGANWSNALNGSNDGWHIDVKNAITAAVASEAEEVNVYLAAGDYSITNQLVLSSITIPVKFSGGYVGATDGSMEKSAELKTTLKRNTSYKTRFFYGTSLDNLTIDDVSFTGGFIEQSRGRGGVLYLTSCSVCISKCIFSDNKVLNTSGCSNKENEDYGFSGGGVIYAKNGFVCILDSEFLSNEIGGRETGGNTSGASILTRKADLKVARSLFKNGYLNAHKSLPFQFGGAIATYYGNNVEIEDCQFVGNRGRGGSKNCVTSGGSLAIRNTKHFKMVNSYFKDSYIANGSKEVQYFYQAGVVQLDDWDSSDGVMTSVVERCVFDAFGIPNTVSPATATTTQVPTQSDITLSGGSLFMTNCLITSFKGAHPFATNSIRAVTSSASKKNGSGYLYATSGTWTTAPTYMELENVSIADCKGVGAIATGDAILKVNNCIFNGNKCDVINAESIEYSCLQQEHEGTGNFVADPQWTGYPYYHLLTKNANGSITNGWFSGTFESPKCAADSPCIDAGAPGSPGLNLEPYYSGRRVNIGAYGGTPWASKTSPLPGFKLIVR